jgi:hypothetical protein
MTGRMKRALLWASSALVLCLVPLFGRVWLERHGALERPELGVVGEFVLRDHLDVPLTRDQMRRAVTVIVHWPANCQRASASSSSSHGPATSACENSLKTANMVHEWVNNSLKSKWSEDKNTLILAIVGDGAASLTEFTDWRKFALKPIDGTILPAGTDLSKAWLVVVDNSLQFAAREDLEASVDFEALGRVLSKTAFDQYLGNYLSKRTFMGPRRTQN